MRFVWCGIRRTSAWLRFSVGAGACFKASMEDELRAHNPNRVVQMGIVIIS